MHTKFLYVTVGLPFAGKTTWARNFVSESKEVFSRDQILEDFNKDMALRQYLFVESQKILFPTSRIYDTKEQNAWNDVVSQEYVKQVVQKIRHSNKDVIIVDGTHLSVESRKFVAQDFDRKKIAIVFSLPKQICIDRWKCEKKEGIRLTLSEELIEKMDTLKVLPQTEETFDEILFVN